MSFSKKELIAYEKLIRALLLDDLYDIVDVVRKDASNERLKIVEARIEELEKIPPTIPAAEDLNKELEDKLNENTPLGYSFLSILGVVISLAALLMFKDGDKPLVFRLLSLGLFCFFLQGIIYGCTPVRGGNLHKKAYPKVFIITEAFYLLLGLGSFIASFGLW